MALPVFLAAAAAFQGISTRDLRAAGATGRGAGAGVKTGCGSGILRGIAAGAALRRGANRGIAAMTGAWKAGRPAGMGSKRGTTIRRRTGARTRSCGANDAEADGRRSAKCMAGRIPSRRQRGETAVRSNFNPGGGDRCATTEPCGSGSAWPCPRSCRQCPCRRWRQQPSQQPQTGKSIEYHGPQ